VFIISVIVLFNVSALFSDDALLKCCYRSRLVFTRYRSDTLEVWWDLSW